MNIQPQYALENTFGLPSKAQWGGAIEQISDVHEALDFVQTNNLKLICLGAGSNVILQPQLAGLVCSMRITGVVVLEETDESVLVEVGAGVSWHEFVLESLSRSWFGLENLALIPGLVGAGPVQNIGAYGVELSQFVVAVNVVDGEGAERQVAHKDCQFAYRSSVFKAQPDWIIVSVVLRLSKLPLIEISYPDLENALKDLAAPSPEDVAQSVIGLRGGKLPNPAEFANAGSFFKNPIVNGEQSIEMQAHGFKAFAHGEVFKLSAAQLIDRAGWKGIRRGDVGCWPQQPLVIVNYGGASCADILSFAEDVAHGVKEQYQIQLELEPSVLS